MEAGGSLSWSKGVQDPTRYLTVLALRLSMNSRQRSHDPSIGCSEMAVRIFIINDATPSSARERLSTL